MGVSLIVVAFVCLILGMIGGSNSSVNQLIDKYLSMQYNDLISIGLFVAILGAGLLLLEKGDDIGE